MPSIPAAPKIIVLAGPSGVGKTVIGKALAGQLGGQFHDADDLHPGGNRAKMSAGIPLDEHDRIPWLKAVRGAIERWLKDGAWHVLACSALRRSHRQQLAGKDSRVRIVLLLGKPPLLAARLQERSGHFFPPTLLRSQLETLEMPEPDEGVAVLDVPAAGSPDDLAERIAQEFCGGKRLVSSRRR